MMIRVGLSGLLALSLLLNQNLVLAAVSGLSITDRQLISKQRVSRTAIDYTYTLTAHNTGAPLSGVVATVSSLSGNTVIQQAEVVFGALDSGSTQSTETFVLRQDRRVAFDPADLVYTFTADVPAAAAMPALSFEPVKIFRFSWTDVDTATHYKLLENPDGKSGFTQVGEDIPQDTESIDHVVPLYARINGQYVLQSCNAAGCRDSAAVAVSGTLVGSIGYVKASNTDGTYYPPQFPGEYAAFNSDQFGLSVSLSGDGDTLAVGAPEEESNATGINGDQGDNSAKNSGAVYVFTRSGGVWFQQAYIKASNTEEDDYFGRSVSLSGDGDTLAVGAAREDSNATGINGDQGNNSLSGAGAVYVFTRSGGIWFQQAYVKASNTGIWNIFGVSVSLSGDGDTLAVGAAREHSNATGVNGDQSDNSALSSGAVYVFTRGEGTWFQQAYIKASNTGRYDFFGASVSLSGDGDTLAVGAAREDSNATGINGDQGDNSEKNSGAVYVFTRSGGTWFQQAYVKASNTEGINDDADFFSRGDGFGAAISLSGDGDTLAVGAPGEGSNATGINGDQGDNSTLGAGAVYVFIRSGNTWSQQAYVKASNTRTSFDPYDEYPTGDVYMDGFGTAISLSEDGDTLAVGASWEDSNATGINGDQGNDLTQDSGAVYVFTRSGGTWFQQAYVKASNTGGSYWHLPDMCVGPVAYCWFYEYGDEFGGTISLSSDGNILAVGGGNEDSDATGVNGDQSDNTATYSGAVYLY
ncbi:MAG: FG-GAP repeat protein [Gammaproteobacteria bacterium]|nr:FG-GAP repeat protein [Gammaproteobacteria bacterium]